jgi:parallel beta-helix repeat protein
MACIPERLPVFAKGGVTKFTELEDAPKSYTGQAGKAVKVKTTEDGLEFGTAGVTKFTELSDVPSSYTGQAGKALLVKTTEDGLEFGTAGGGRRTATKIVAANDSLDKSLADYVCDGTDDQEEINAAINALPTSGGRVLLLEGTYNISAPITILKNNVTLEGQGAGTKLFLVNGADCDVIDIGNGLTALEGIKIANLRIDGNKANQTEEHEGIYFWGESNYLIIKSIIENCIVENVSDYGIFLYYSNNNTIIGNQSNSNAYDGIFLSNSNNNTVIGNQANSNGDIGIDIEQANNNIIIGNQINSNASDGIYFISSSNNTISGNQINSNGNNGILLVSATNTTIIGNQINSNASDGIYFSDSDNNTIIGNRCQGNAGYGINISDSPSAYNLVAKNYLTGNTTGSLNDAGTGTIKAASTTNDNVV